MRVLLSLSFVSVVAVACDQPPYIPPKIEPDTTETETDTETIDETVDPNCAIQPTLSDLREKYFSRSCTFGGCHDSSSAAGDLSLQGAGVHAALVNVPAADAKANGRGKMRVVPSDPDNSYFLQKLDGTMQRDEGNLMPDGVDEPIDPNCRIRMVRQWISNGALDN